MFRLFILEAEDNSLFKTNKNSIYNLIKNTIKYNGKQN